ncbi:MAG: NAD(P)H-dependent oxidoreductase [Cellulosilyticaceae bacterium]
MASKQVLILNAAPRKKGTSTSFAKAMVTLLEQKGHQGHIEDLIDYYDQKVSMDRLREKMTASDLVALVIPCYVNTLPAPAIWCLEQLAGRDRRALEGKGCFAIVQGGMPYLDVHEPCVRTTRLFAKQMKMQWLGGVIFGMGPMIDGKPLASVGGVGKKYLKGLERVMACVLDHQSITLQIQKKVTMPMPVILAYPMSVMLNTIGNKMRKEKGVKNFDCKPYL